MISIRVFDNEDLSAVQKFYSEMEYSGGLNPSDRLVIAKEESRIIGVLRVCEEQGHLLLRGMRVRPDRRGQGIGELMLAVAETVIGQRTCYGLAYPDLVAFYGHGCLFRSYARSRSRFGYVPDSAFRPPRRTGSLRHGISFVRPAVHLPAVPLPSEDAGVGIHSGGGDSGPQGVHRLIRRASTAAGKMEACIPPPIPSPRSSKSSTSSRSTPAPAMATGFPILPAPSWNR